MAHPGGRSVQDLSRQVIRLGGSVRAVDSRSPRLRLRVGLLSRVNGVLLSVNITPKREFRAPRNLASFVKVGIGVVVAPERSRGRRTEVGISGVGRSEANLLSTATCGWRGSRVEFSGEIGTARGGGKAAMFEMSRM